MARTNPGTFYERGSAFFAAYVPTPTGELPDPTWIASNGVVWKIYDESAGGTLVHTVTRSATATGDLPDGIAIVSATTNKGYGWPDSIGWNIGIVLDTSEWNAGAGSVGDRTYRIEWSVTFTTAPTAPDYIAEKVIRFSQRGVCLSLTA